MGISPEYQRVKALCDSRLAWESRPSIKGLKPCVTVDLHGNLARVSKG